MKKSTRERSDPLPLPGIHDWSGHTKRGLPWHVHRGDVVETLKKLEPTSVQCVVTSPPYYWQRDYQVEGQWGLEKTIDGYVENLVSCMGELKRVLKKDGTLFLNLGDTYYSAKGQPKGNDNKSKSRRFGLRAVDASGLGVPRKTLLGLPWRVALRMIEHNWVLRSSIIWQRHNTLPEPTAKDRPWRTYEFVFLFSKQPRYYFDRTEVRGLEDVWRIPLKTNASKGLHSAAFPMGLAEKCIRCGSKDGDVVLDPFSGSGTTLLAAVKNGRGAVGIDLKQEYCEYAVQQLTAV